jgi:hypothetical protein
MNHSGCAVVVQLDEIERNKVAPDATPSRSYKCRKSAIKSSIFRFRAMRFELPK